PGAAIRPRPFTTDAVSRSQPSMPRDDGAGAVVVARRLRYGVMAVRPLAALAVILAALLPPADARATCNAIPNVPNGFRAALGTVDRPFARPGDPVGIDLLGPCATTSSGFAGGEVVTVVFTPPHGARSVVVLAESCAPIAVAAAACGATCIP